MVKIYQAGDAQQVFSIQSISKVSVYEEAEIWLRVGKESSEQAFNSLVQLEFERGISRNPKIQFDKSVVSSEFQHLARNSAIAYLIKTTDFVVMM